MQCDQRYLSLCANPAVTNRDGYSGANANIYLPFYGIYFFSGAQAVFPGSTISQNTSPTIGGIKKCSTQVPCGC